jgi:hypothetical protein
MDFIEDPLAPVKKNSLIDRKFSVGQPVIFDSRWVRGVFTVTGQLPARGNEPAYSIKSASEEFERIATESQLSPA